MPLAPLLITIVPLLVPLLVLIVKLAVPCVVMVVAVALAPTCSVVPFSLNVCAGAAPAIICLNTKSKSSLVAVTSVTTESICKPISLLPIVVSVINWIPVPIPFAGVPLVV